MAIASPPTDFTGIMGNLAVLSGQQEQNKQQGIKTKEFLDTHNNRVKQANADLELQTQESEMKQESNKALKEQGLHVKQAVAGAKSATQKSETEEKAALRKEQWYDYTAINSDSAHKQAVLGRIKAGEALDDIYADIGEYYDPDLIKARSADALDSPATAAAKGLQEGKDAAAMDRTRVDAAARITAAQIARDGQIARARATGRAQAAGGLLVGEPPTISNESFSLAAMTDVNKDNTGWFSSDKGLDDPEVVAKTHAMASIANNLAAADAERWDLAIQSGNPLPANMNPNLRLDEYMRRAEAIELGTVRPGAGLTPAEEATSTQIQMEVARNPQGRIARSVEALQMKYGMPYKEAVTALTRERLGTSNAK